MRRLRYHVAMSLDGFIAGPKGEYDWIVMDPTIDFTAFYSQFDTALMGRRTFELALTGPGAIMPGIQTIVCSRTLRGSDHQGVTIVSEATDAVSTLKSKPGKDIWLFGGGTLFRGLLDAGLVDTIEVAVTPIMLSQGLSLLPAGRRSPPLELVDCKSKPNGIITLSYQVGSVRSP
ncbi:MAG TPA: dihydrofolate reductase family protein [Verrucomicrobiae bacterium]|nr:dihydrofolate reductase family protein [Verrucomicrobiae bacterium]